MTVIVTYEAWYRAEALLRQEIDMQTQQIRFRQRHRPGRMNTPEYNNTSGTALQGVARGRKAGTPESLVEH